MKTYKIYDQNIGTKTCQKSRSIDTTKRDEFYSHLSLFILKEKMQDLTQHGIDVNWRVSRVQISILRY